MTTSNTRTACCSPQRNPQYIRGSDCPLVRVHECDILVIGAGAAGLTAAASVREQGLRVLLVEKDDYVGGTTFRSGGCVWMPDNPRMQEQGIEDSREKAECYMRAMRKAKVERQDRDPVQEALWQKWLEAYLTQGPRMMDHLSCEGFKWMTTPSSIPDYHVRDGAVEYGRTVDPEVFDAVTLNAWLKYLPPQDNTLVIPRFEDIFTMTRSPCSVDGAAQAFHPPQAAVRPMSMGRSLVAQLLKICKNHNNVEIWTGCELQELRYSDKRKRVTGARIWCGRQKGLVDIHALLGVVLTTGGFSQNQEMRDTYLKFGLSKATMAQVSTTAEWSLAAPSDRGIAVQVSQRLGAATAQLDQVWGIPTMIDPATGRLREAMFAITKPFSFVTDAYGCRFFSESQPYGVAVAAMYKRAKTYARGNVFLLIFDDNYMQRYGIGSLAGHTSVSQAVDSGGHTSVCQAVDSRFLSYSKTISGLAEKILHQHHKLNSTTKKWNEMCETGEDNHFQRGQDRYQRFTGDPTVKPNPCMGPVEVGPFYAIKIFPGDAGTRGGLVTDEFARVLDKGQEPIKGLFAGGNASVSWLETEGAGTTIGPAMTEGFVAAMHIMTQQSLGDAASDGGLNQDLS